MLVIYSICISVASTRGFGKPMADIPTKSDITTAILWEAAGQTFVVFAVWVSKSSLAFFLLRLAGSRKQKIAIMIPNVALCLSVTAALLLFWLGCKPIAYLWDRSIPGGTCLATETTSVSLLAGCLSIFTDFFYASFPWYLLWGTAMPSREKLLIQLSLSLGVLWVALSSPPSSCNQNYPHRYSHNCRLSRLTFGASQCRNMWYREGCANSYTGQHRISE